MRHLVARRSTAWPGLVERHHDDGRPVAADEPGLSQELLLALLEADRVDDALALHALQSGLDDLPLRAVDHHRHVGDVRLAGDQPQELRHRFVAVEQGVVHVDVDDVGPAFDLLPGDLDRLLELARRGSAGQTSCEPVTFVRSPIMMKLLSGRCTSGCVPERRRKCSEAGTLARRASGESRWASANGTSPSLARRASVGFWCGLRPSTRRQSRGYAPASSRSSRRRCSPSRCRPIRPASRPSAAGPRSYWPISFGRPALG